MLILCEFTEKSNFQEGVTGNQCIGGKCLKREAWTTSRFKRQLGEKEVMVFLRGFDSPMHTMACRAFLFVFKY